MKSKTVDACDFEEEAINYAKSHNSFDNISYHLSDIRKNIPAGKYDNIIWDAAIEHFTLEESHKILDCLKERLLVDGILSGYTILEKPDGKQLTHHEHEFSSKGELLQLISPFFKNTIVFETIYPNRHNLYFWASDGVLPFQKQSRMFVMIEK